MTKCAYESASAVQRAFAPADAKVSEGGKLDGMLIGPDDFVKARLSEDVDKMVGVMDVVAAAVEKGNVPAHVGWGLMLRGACVYQMLQHTLRGTYPSQAVEAARKFGAVREVAVGERSQCRAALRHRGRASRQLLVTQGP